MNRKVSFIVIIWLFAGFLMFGQTTEYEKFHLSFRAGMDFPLGASNTSGVDPEFTLPFARGFGATADGAYFFHKNYGVGLKYHLFSAKMRDKWVLIRPDDKVVGYSFNETTHFIGPVVYARWLPTGNSKWEIPVSVGIGYVSNKLSKYLEKVRYYVDTEGLNHIDPNRMSKDYGRSDMNTSSIGFVFSAGVCYRVSPVVSIGVYADGMFSSGEKTLRGTTVFGDPVTFEFSRKMNRIGISAGINFNF